MFAHSSKFPRKHAHSLAAFVVFAVSLIAASAVRASLTIDNLLCEGLSAPLGVDVESPRLSWRLTATERGENQAAYQILVATSAELLARDQGDLWSTGRVPSPDTFDIAYTGRPLASSQQVFWKVRVWNADGSQQPSSWSAVASFTMGVLNTPLGPGWQPGVQWITDPALLRWVRKGYGFSSRESKSENGVKWVQLDLGASRQIDSVVLRAIQHTLEERFGFPVRFKVEASDEGSFKSPSQITLIADYSSRDYSNSWASVITIPSPAPAEKPIRARFIRVTANKLRVPDAGKPCLAYSQIEVLSEGKNIALGAVVTASDLSEDLAHWSAAALVDGLGTSSENPRANTTLLLRREFAVRPGLVRALAHVTGLGQYEFAVNGVRVSTGVLTPGWTNYSKTVLYDTYDITAQIRSGSNAVGFVLAGGFYNVQAGPENRYHKFTSVFRPLVAYGQIRLEYNDGTADTISTDNAWRVISGPTTYANVYGGEDYDAQREPRGWSEPEFDDRAWGHAVDTAGPGGTLLGVTNASPHFAFFETLAPVSIKKISEGVSVYDFGQNASMMIQLRVHGPAGGMVRITPAELIKADGTVDRASCGGGKAYWQYTLRGDPLGETWQPEFFYHGSRYVQVELLPAGSGGASGSGQPEDSAFPVVDKLESRVTHSNSAPAGEFVCSNDLLNRIRTLVRWAQRSNLAHVITDCPHRERLGWLEQYHLNGPALRYEWDIDRLYTKCFRDMADSQTSTGLIPSIAPEYVVFPGGFRDSPEWGSAFILAMWQHYVWTGDAKPLKTYYDAMADYVEYLGSRSKKYVLSHGLGDWYDIGPKRPGIAQLTPIGLTATAAYYEATSTLARIAEMLGRYDDARRYSKEASKIAEAFNRSFLNSNGDGESKKAAKSASATAAVYATGSQTSQAMPLVLELVPRERRDAALATLVERVHADGNAVTAGDVGFHYLLRALADGGHSALIFSIINQTEKPGYGYQLEHGATSLTEAWDTDRRSSQNHFMLGHITEWFYHDVAGLQPDPNGPGFRHVIIRPAIVGDLTFARATHEAPRGLVRSAWHREAGKLVMEISIPVGSTATVYVPTKNPSTVREGNVFAAKAKGVRALRGGAAGNEAVFEIDSGNYVFTADY